MFWEKWGPKITPEDRLFLVAPKEFRKSACNSYHSNLLKAFNNLLESDQDIRFDAIDIYQNLTKEDRELARQWQKNSEDFEKAKMLAARGAEIAVKRFYEKMNFSVVDIAMEQTLNIGDDWKTHDLYVKNKGPVDVKNARTPVNSDTFFVEQTVKRFKESQAGDQVAIFGVVSPYLRVDYMESKKTPNFCFTPIRLLGEIDGFKLKKIEKDFTTDYFFPEIYNLINNVIPSWAYEYPSFFYLKHKESTAEIDLIKQTRWPTEEEWQYLDIPIHLFLATGCDLPSAYAKKLDEWQVVFIEKILSNYERSGLTRPRIFLTIMLHFLDMLRSDNPPKSYSPKKYQHLLFGNDDHQGRYPAARLDPVAVIKGLCKTLETMWEHRESKSLSCFSTFRLRGLGLLQGKKAGAERWETLLAWCGGRIEGKGSCGNAPLVIGKVNTCNECGKLICNICGFCSKGCKRNQQAETNGNLKAEFYPSNLDETLEILPNDYDADYAAYLEYLDKFQDDDSIP